MKQGKTLEQLGAELQRQRNSRADFIADTRKLNFSTDNNKSRITFENGGKTLDFGINPLVHQQIASRLGIPLKYYQRMQAEAPALLDENVNNWLEQTPARRMLRIMDGNIRAFLSDRYRRLDNLELCAAVLPIIHEMKGVIIESCEVTEAHLYLKVVNKKLKTEVAVGDVVQAGFVISNSEVGLGHLTVEPMIFRLVCKNGLICKDFSQKKRHIGRQVETYDTAYEIYSDETLAQDDKAFFMKVQDTVRTAVGENKFMMTVNHLQEAMEFPLEHNPMEDRVNLNVETWVNEWLETVKLNILPRTYEKYKSCLIGYIVPKYKERKLKDLNMQSLNNHFITLLNSGRNDGKGLSTSTVRATRRYFCMCLDDAVKAGLIMVNPVRLTKPPKLVKKEIVVLSATELNDLIEAAKNIQHPFISVMMPEIISLTARTGLRQGEVFGLKWEDIDFNLSCLFVRRSLAHIMGKGAVFQEPKTKNSRRRILLLSDDIAKLKTYKEWQNAYADKLGNLFSRNGLVFTSPYGEPISPSNFSRRYFKPLLKECGIDENFTFHGLRHTHATLLLEQGVNPKIVQERLGHSSIKVTMDTYSHVLPDMQKQAVKAMEKIFD